MDDTVSILTGAQGTDDKSQEIGAANDGFLGTGSSLLVELSYIAMALIAAYVAFGIVRYFLPDVRIVGKILEAIGLQEK